eukprot:281079-Rhodomonas_salina.1
MGCRTHRSQPRPCAPAQDRGPVTVLSLFCASANNAFSLTADANVRAAGKGTVGLRVGDRGPQRCDCTRGISIPQR